MSLKLTDPPSPHISSALEERPPAGGTIRAELRDFLRSAHRGRMAGAGLRASVEELKRRLAKYVDAKREEGTG